MRPWQRGNVLHRARAGTVRAAGAGGVLLAFLLLWLIGAMPRASDPAAALAPRLAAIEAQLRDLAARPAPITIDPKAIDDLATRLAKVESTIATPRPPVTDPVMLSRLGATDGA